MVKKVFSGTITGIKSDLVTVEVALRPEGRKGLSIVGMGDMAIRESRKRILTALSVVGVEVGDIEISVNLAPADLRKEGTAFDLPIAMGIMASLGILKVTDAFLEETLFLGELSFDGTLYSHKGILNLLLDANKLNKKRVILPYDNYAEGRLVEGLEVRAFRSLRNLILYFNKDIYEMPVIKSKAIKPKPIEDYSDIKGHEQAKRIFQIGAAGHHNIILVGPPGSGKTMLSSRMGGLMEPLSNDQILETTRLYSSSGEGSTTALIKDRPFRSPHHTISQAGMVGGGSPIKPGEISLAHNGILFMDEFTEFRRNVIESLRQPLESGMVTVTRAQYTVDFPARFILVSALNPCPCGLLGDKANRCSCSMMNIYNYLNKVSGPLLDRMDLQAYLPSISREELEDKKPSLSTAELKRKISVALKRQEQRFGNAEMRNAYMTAKDIELHCHLTPEAKTLLNEQYDRLGMSMRSLHKVIKIARTIADLENEDAIQLAHLKEALMYRGLEQKISMLKKRIG